MTSPVIPSPKGEKVIAAAKAILEAEKMRGTGAFFEAVEKHALTLARALLSSSSREEVRREALEEAARAIEAKHTNSVGMIHPMAESDAKAIRALSQGE